MKIKLLASSHSIDGITKLIHEYFLSKFIKLIEHPITAVWFVMKTDDKGNLGHQLKDYRVIRKGKRFRFETWEEVSK